MINYLLPISLGVVSLGAASYIYNFGLSPVPLLIAGHYGYKEISKLFIKNIQKGDVQNLVAFDENNDDLKWVLRKINNENIIENHKLVELLVWWEPKASADFSKYLYLFKEDNLVNNEQITQSLRNAKTLRVQEPMKTEQGIIQATLHRPNGETEDCLEIMQKCVGPVNFKYEYLKGLTLQEMDDFQLLNAPVGSKIIWQNFSMNDNELSGDINISNIDLNIDL